MPSYRRKSVDAVIDVRSRLEYWFGHLEGATCISVGQLPAKIERVKGIGLNSRILVYCASGARSAMAAQMLKAQGYTRVIDGGSLAAVRAEYSAT